MRGPQPDSELDPVERRACALRLAHVGVDQVQVAFGHRHVLVAKGVHEDERVHPRLQAEDSEGVLEAVGVDVADAGALATASV